MIYSANGRANERVGSADPASEPGNETVGHVGPEIQKPEKRKNFFGGLGTTFPTQNYPKRNSRLVEFCLFPPKIIGESGPQNRWRLDPESNGSLGTIRRRIGGEKLRGRFTSEIFANFWP